MRSLIVLLMYSLISIGFPAYGEETCSRMANINYQEVMVDSNSGLKGEGLRFFLQKDEVAKKYLDQYQSNNQIRWQNAMLGTVGTGLIITGFVSSTARSNKNRLVISGISLLIFNFLVSRTYDYHNEKNLMRSIEEYNKRNIPRIQFEQDIGSNNPKSFQPIAFINYSKEI